MNDKTKTNSRNFLEERPLTEGEKAMARQVFGEGIEYDKVKIYGKEYPLTLGAQPNDRAMAPNGNIYFSSEDSSQSRDFSTASDEQKKTFIHEMTHVWQNHSGRAVKLEGLGVQTWNTLSRAFGGNPRAGYDYDFDSTKKLSDYNMEQQGEIIAEYYMARFENRPPLSGRTAAEYEQMLSEFLRDPLYDKKKIEQERREREEQDSRASTQGLNPATPLSSNYNLSATNQILAAFGAERNGVKTNQMNVLTKEMWEELGYVVPDNIKGTKIGVRGAGDGVRIVEVHHFADLIADLNLHGKELEAAQRDLEKNFVARVNKEAGDQGRPSPVIALAPASLQPNEHTKDKGRDV